MTRYVTTGLCILLISFADVALESRLVQAQSPSTCGDASRQKLGVNLARQINTSETTAYQRAGAYAALSDLQGLGIAQDFTTQLLVDSSGTAYVFSVKDGLCPFALFSDQLQIIYVAQPLQ